MKENEIVKDNLLKKVHIDDDKTLENMKKYYNIDDHTDLLKFIKLNGIVNHDHYHDKKDNDNDKLKSKQSS
jgi:hypothetical protein